MSLRLFQPRLEVTVEYGGANRKVCGKLTEGEAKERNHTGVGTWLEELTHPSSILRKAARKFRMAVQGATRPATLREREGEMVLLSEVQSVTKFSAIHWQPASAT